MFWVKTKVTIQNICHLPGTDFLLLHKKNICYIQGVKHNGKHRDPVQGRLGELSHFAEHTLGPLPYTLEVRFLVLQVWLRKGMQRLVL